MNAGRPEEKRQERSPSLGGTRLRSILPFDILNAETIFPCSFPFHSEQDRRLSHFITIRHGNDFEKLFGNRKRRTDSELK
ncbi:hypothetical protein NPIL_219441 [Nephila pilipes]|uniref:Uncharacterized protein n=1 Tax=Nephila pilipes TaxID=299642 RepID=A0A8X6NTX7_NEPPI|nr:hypothetical protein NPIL_39351 [Nephila pilipes]GFT32816.1 hypothetical protein NPIL_219441 [Nephila pilipes]